MLNGPLINIGRRSTVRCHNRGFNKHILLNRNTPIYRCTRYTVTLSIANYVWLQRLFITAIRLSRIVMRVALGFPTLCEYIDDIVHIDYTFFFFFKLICEYATFCVHFMLLFIVYFINLWRYRTYRVSLILFSVTAKTCQSIIYILHNGNKAYK